MTAAQRYRKLPGARRGIIRGASVWMGEDHLLSVKSFRIREEYKRFYFRDIQGIVVARAPRFHISTRALLLAVAWLAAYGVVANGAPHYTWIPWSIAAALVLAWIVISARFSCRCRLNTAVSRDELPSVYRTWTAAKFLRKVTPAIVAVQGDVPAGWADAAEKPEPAPAEPLPASPESAASAGARVHTAAADIFVATLFCSGLVDLLLLHANSRPATLTQLTFALILLAETVILFVQHYRGSLQAPMRNLAIANLIAVGAMYYVRQMVAGFSVGINAGRGQQAQSLKIPIFDSGGLWTRAINAGVCIILGLVGLGIILLRKDRR